MTVDKLDPDLLESAAAAAELAHESDSLDAENTLKPEFVRRVREGLEAGENDAVYGMVEGLHPADIADLFELLDSDERPALALAISDLMGSEVYAELNDYVREDIVEQLPAETVADIAEHRFNLPDRAIGTHEHRFVRAAGHDAHTPSGPCHPSGNIAAQKPGPAKDGDKLGHDGSLSVSVAHGFIPRQRVRQDANRRSPAGSGIALTAAPHRLKRRNTQPAQVVEW